MARYMGIKLDEIIELGNQWFETVMGGGSGKQQSAFFMDPNSRVYVMPSGISFNFDEHYELHTQWINEIHEFGDFNLTPLSESPERVRATGTVYWQAEFPDRPAPNIIKAVVGEDWIIERLPSGELKFVLYMNTFHHPLPDSAPLFLENP